MRKKEQAIQLLLQQKLLPLYYHDSAEVSVNILQALYAGGIRILEYTNRGEHALKNFATLKKAQKKMPGLLMGIGTIKNKQQAKHYIKAGADFIVCPSINAEVAKVTHDADLLWIPGCMTPTEIAAAENAGATLVKIFPGNILGPSYISSIKDLFPNIKFMPTGGVELEEANLRSWFAAGVIAVGMGSKLLTSDLIKSKNYKAISQLSNKALYLISSIKNQ